MIYAKDIIKLCHGEVIGNKEITLDNFIIDSRKIEKDDVYVAIVGENNDGNKYTESALEKGAKAVIISDSKYLDINKYQDKTIIIVPDTLKCLQELARYKRSLYQGKVIAITGSVGKTSTKDMVSALLQSEYKVHKTQGNMNNHLGLPLTILSLKDEDILVVEMGMNHFGEISTLTNIAKPNIAIITNIGTAHIGNLGSRENILKAKLEILEGLDKNGVLVINNDNDLLHEHKDEIKTKVITIGINNQSDYMASNIQEDMFSSSFLVNNKEKVLLPQGGRASIYNYLVGYAICDYLGVKDKIKGLNNLESSKNRLEIKETSMGYTIIDDSYNASYDSVKNSLDLIGKSPKRKIVVLGDILELDKYGESIHRSIAPIVIANKIDKLFLVGDMAKYIGLEAIKLGYNPDNIYYFSKESDSYQVLEKELKKDDIVLFKASHCINLNKIVDYLMNKSTEK